MAITWATVKSVLNAFLAGLIAALAWFGLAKARQRARERKDGSTGGGETEGSSTDESGAAEAKKAGEEAREKAYAGTTGDAIDSLGDTGGRVDAARDAARRAALDGLGKDAP